MGRPACRRAAAREGGPDPAANLALQNAVEKARSYSMPKDNIERAIAKGAGTGDDASAYETIVYEGYAAGGVAVLVEALTDNRNRTASEVRHIFAKNEGNLGTTGAVAKRLGRSWIGIDREGEYIEAAQERIEAALPLDESALATMMSPRAQPKVAFGVLVENAYLAPGTVLTDGKRRWRATIRADGSLLSDCGTIGSIHKLGSTLQNAPACNGWSFWHYESDKGLKPIDDLRQTYLLATTV